MLRVASRQNVSVCGGRSFGFLPQVGAFGVVDRAEDAFFGKWDFFAYRFYEVFHILALGGVICWTGIFDDGERKPFYRGADVVFLDVDEGTYERDAALVHISGRRKAGKPAFVQQGHQNGLRHVVGVCLLYTSPSPRD